MVKNKGFKPLKLRKATISKSTPDEKRCWQTEIGNKHRILCNTDPVAKRKFVREDVFNHLAGCVEATVDGRDVTYVEPNRLQYQMQSGRIKSIRCKRRKTGARCWNAKIQRDAKTKLEIPICENDSIDRKVDVLDAVDGLLAGCSQARFWHGYKPKGRKSGRGDSFTIRRVGGLNSTDRRIAGSFMLSGDAREVRCVQRTKRR